MTSVHHDHKDNAESPGMRSSEANPTSSSPYNASSNTSVTSSRDSDKACDVGDGRERATYMSKAEGSGVRVMKGKVQESLSSKTNKPAEAQQQPERGAEESHEFVGVAQDNDPT